MTKATKMIRMLEGEINSNIDSPITQRILKEKRDLLLLGLGEGKNEILAELEYLIESFDSKEAKSEVQNIIYPFILKAYYKGLEEGKQQALLEAGKITQEQLKLITDKAKVEGKKEVIEEIEYKFKEEFTDDYHISQIDSSEWDELKLKMGVEK